MLFSTRTSRPATRLAKRLHDDSPDVVQTVAVDEWVQTRIEEKEGHGVLYDATEDDAEAQNALRDDRGDVRNVADQKQAVDPQHARRRLPERRHVQARAASPVSPQPAVDFDVRGRGDYHAREHDKEHKSAVNLRAQDVRGSERGGEQPNQCYDHSDAPHRHDVAVAAVVTESDEAVRPDGRHRGERRAADHRSDEDVRRQAETAHGGDTLYFGHQGHGEQRLGEQAHDQVRQHQGAQQQLGRRVQRLGRTDGVENQHVRYDCDDRQRHVDGRCHNVRNGTAVDFEVDVLKKVAYSRVRACGVCHRVSLERDTRVKVRLVTDRFYFRVFRVTSFLGNVVSATIRKKQAEIDLWRSRVM